MSENYELKGFWYNFSPMENFRRANYERWFELDIAAVIPILVFAFSFGKLTLGQVPFLSSIPSIAFFGAIPILLVIATLLYNKRSRYSTFGTITLSKVFGQSAFFALIPFFVGFDLVTALTIGAVIQVVRELLSFLGLLIKY